MNTERLTVLAEHASQPGRVTLRVSTPSVASGRIQPFAVLAFALISAVAPSLKAASYEQAVQTAHAFLRTEERGKEILSYVHFGADYHGHSYLRTVPVNNDPDGFALIYRFWWEDDGVTDVAFLCDSRGYVYKVQIMATNAVLSQPFVFANASIQVLGNSLIEMYKDKLSKEDELQLRELVRRADAKSLLEFSLKLEQQLD